MLSAEAVFNVVVLSAKTVVHVVELSAKAVLNVAGLSAKAVVALSTKNLLFDHLTIRKREADNLITRQLEN
jgi:hypothetical protein